MPKTIEVVFGNRVDIERTALPPALVNRLIRIAACQNPEFCSAQAMLLQASGDLVCEAGQSTPNAAPPCQSN
jgi:hypothetical protein